MTTVSRHNCLGTGRSLLLALVLHNSGLHEAILGSNNLYGIGLEALSQGLAENKGLRRLTKLELVGEAGGPRRR